MSVAIEEEPRVVHALAGRLRIHVPAWEGCDGRPLERQLRSMTGVRSAQVNSLTGNILVVYDPMATNSAAILTRIRTVSAEQPEPGDGVPAEPGRGASRPYVAPAPPPVLRERRGRARIAVRGIDRDPALARRVVERLQQFPSVRASASQLTGRVLVEYDEHRVEINDLIAEITDMELPDLPDEDRPSHPLDPAPLVQSATRTAGAAAGLSLLAARQLAGRQGPPVGSSAPAFAAGVIGIVQGFPASRNGLRALLGRHVADLLFQGAAIVSLALSGSPLGLAVTGSEALRLLTEVLARRAAWKRYVARLGDDTAVEPGAEIRLEAGQRTPLTAKVVEGTGNAIGRDGMPRRVAPGETIPAGARLFGGPFVLALGIDKPFVPEPRPAPVAPTLYSRYVEALGPISLAYAGLTLLLTRSLSRTFTALLLVTPRAAVIGSEAADIGAAARALRGGVTVVGTRANRPIRLPGALLLDSARVLTNGFEIRIALPLNESFDSAEILARAAGVAIAAGSPWGNAFPTAGAMAATEGTFDGTAATAIIDGVRHTLGPIERGDVPLKAARLRQPGNQLLALGREGEKIPIGIFALRPRLAAGTADLVATCKRHGVELGVLATDDERLAAQQVALRAGVPLLYSDDPVAVVRSWQAAGARVAFAADSAHGAAAFAACDLAIGVSSGRSSRFPARADVLAPDLRALAAIVEAGARRDAATRDGVAFSMVANAVGAAWGFRGAPGMERASKAVYIASLAALAVDWLRLRGGERPAAASIRLVDPRPERWGRRSVADALEALNTTEAGLSSSQAAARRQPPARVARGNDLLRALLDQVRSPLTGILAAGAALSLVLGSPLDFALIGATVAVNVAVGAWQEQRAGQAAAALERLGAATARVLRDGEAVTIPATEVVPGDVLVLASGDRVAADARLLEAQNLEVDEAALTGESLPVAKAPDSGTDAGRVILEGSDILVGTGRAVVVAVGGGTRMGATAAALGADNQQSPLGVRLSRMLRQILPVAAAGGAIVVASGALRGRPLLPQLAIGASIAIAAVPEGLPLLTGVGQAAVANRLAARKALVRRLGAVEALGRVDVACADKTGTLTEGRLALTLVAGPTREAELTRRDSARSAAGTPRGIDSEAPPASSTTGSAPMLDGAGYAATLPIPEELVPVLRAAALASPHPDAADATAHPTDVAIVRGAQEAGLGEDLRVARAAEAPFDPARSFHASVVGDCLHAKGATEALLARCTRVRREGAEQPLDAQGRQQLQARSNELASRGLRVLMVAQGAADVPVDDPRDLVALGFVGISDPLRPDVPEAVQRCRAAGVRVIMLTGDHPATARAIGRQAGLLRDGDDVLTGVEIADLQNGDLERRLEGASVIARVTPLDKVRIVEALQRRGHTVAMTGDGVNDAPALRLADVGVAMGLGGTEVARQAADVVLADDDFATLVEALVEGRSFWRNIRRALALLLGGNLGELGMVVGASVLGLASPLITRQILAVNLITDALPALAVALQRPAHRNLAALAREGASALDVPLRNDVLRRGALAAVPSLAGYLIALGAEGLPQARSVAFASIVSTQLAQTLDAGRAEDGLTRSVVGAVAGSGALLVAGLTVPGLRDLLALAAPTPLSWTLIGGATLLALAASRATTAMGVDRGVTVLPAWPKDRGTERQPADRLPLPAAAAMS